MTFRHSVFESFLRGCGDCVLQANPQVVFRCSPLLLRRTTHPLPDLVSQSGSGLKPFFISLKREACTPATLQPPTRLPCLSPVPWPPPPPTTPIRARLPRPMEPSLFFLRFVFALLFRGCSIPFPDFLDRNCCPDDEPSMSLSCVR